MADTSRTDAISQVPTAVGTPELSSAPMNKIDSKEKRSREGEGGGGGVILTATNTLDTNTIDTLTLDEEKRAIEREEKEGNSPALHKVSTVRKIALLSMFTFAEFLDAFNNSALFPAIPIITADLSFNVSETVWIISAYQLTFAAFLLVSGRISDVYTPKPAFILGCLILGLTHLGGGFVRQKIAMLVLRALGGIGGALTIPSALSMIVQLFPNPAAQARAIALFGMAGAIGNILGVLIGAVLTQYAGWEWVYFFVAIVGCGIGIVCFFLIPNAKRDKSKKVNFDATGVSILTIAVILFIFAVTSGSTKGWGTAYVLCPLIISIAVLAVFLWWEARIPPDHAVMPPRAWRYRNFGVIVGIALLPYFWWVTSFVLLTSWYEQVYGWSVISTAVHFLPMGISAWLIAMFAGQLTKYFAHKYILLFALMLSTIATILLPFADAPDTYWRFGFTAFLIGSVGMMMVYANSSIAIFYYTPPSVAGTVGAVFNCALQLGSAVGLAAVSSITTSVDGKNHLEIPIEEFPRRLNEISKALWKEAYEGRAASYWFLLGILGVEIISVIVFFKVDAPNHGQHDEGAATAKTSDTKVDVENNAATTTPKEKQ
ncbi:hypothetical protein FRC17_009594 [Serendipita sp. 399]|nr:hypothetical protein FRC17_009594 [Serendipita sp. 399]